MRGFLLARKRVISRSNRYNRLRAGTICYWNFNHLTLVASLAELEVEGFESLRV
jgi:hypothetical protein